MQSNYSISVRLARIMYCSRILYPPWCINAKWLAVLCDWRLMEEVELRVFGASAAARHGFATLQTVNCNARRPATIARRSLGGTLVRPYTCPPAIFCHLWNRSRLRRMWTRLVIGQRNRSPRWLSSSAYSIYVFALAIVDDWCIPLSDGRCCPAAVHICLAVAAAINGAVHLFVALVAAIWTSTAVRR